MITILLISGLLAISVIVRHYEERTRSLPRRGIEYPDRYEIDHYEGYEKVYDVKPKSMSIMQAASMQRVKRRKR